MMGGAIGALRVGARGLLCALALVAATVPTVAQRIPDDVAERLNSRQTEAYRAYLTARSAFDRKLDAYWSDVDERREGP